MSKNKGRKQLGAAKKPPKKVASAQAAGVPSILRLDFRGQILELTPTAEHPLEVLLTDQYEEWIVGITDTHTNTRITNAIARMRRGTLGDWKEVNGIFELRLNFGPGYRVYYAKFGKIVIILLGGGDKSSQQKDIRSAQDLWEEIKNEIKEI